MNESKKPIVSSTADLDAIVHKRGQLSIHPSSCNLQHYQESINDSYTQYSRNNKSSFKTAEGR